MTTLYLCGAGNPDGVRLAQRINEHQRRWDDIVILDDDAAKHGRTILGVRVDGGLDVLGNGRADRAELANLVARTTAKRAAVRTKILSHGVPFARMTDPSVDVVGTELAQDTVVYHNATLGAEAVVGEGSVVFMGAVVGHESRVGVGCVIGSNAVLNARVRLEEGVYVGTNATILPEITVGAWATIGAGSVVLQDVPAGATVMGVPGEILACPAHAAAEPCPGDCSATGDPSPTGAVPTAELEQLILGVWHEVLGARELRADKNFFDLGGTSHQALKVYERLRQDPRIVLQMTDLFRFPTVQSLARHLGGGSDPTHANVGLRRLAFRRGKTGPQ